MGNRAEILATLRRSALFQGIPEATLEAIAAVAARHTYEEGDAVYELGDDASEVFIVESGRVRFSLGAGNRGGTSGSIMTEGQIFGWAALLDDQPRRVATSTCLEVSALVVIDGKALLGIFERDTATGYVVMRRLAGLIAANFMDALSN